MKRVELIMGMPITIEIHENEKKSDDERAEAITEILSYFHTIDERFSTYKDTSEITQINRAALKLADASTEMQEVFALSLKTNKETNGYFSIERADGTYDPSGLVKGWAIYNASRLLQEREFNHFFIDAGGDIQVATPKHINKPWTVGIRNPFNREEIVKVVRLRNEGIATSGSYIRGAHIYNPKNSSDLLDQVVSITVIGPNVYEADRFATAAFTMGMNGIAFIEQIPGLEGYQIDRQGNALMTSNFLKYIINE